MLDLALVDTLAYLQGLNSTDLQGVQSFQKSDADIPTMLHPAIAMEWDGIARMVDNGNHVDISGTFGVMLFVTNMQGRAATDKQLADLLFRWDVSLGRWAGLLPALWRLRRWENTDVNQTFIVTVHRDVRAGRLISKNQQHYSAGASVTLDVRTLLDRPTYGLDLP